MITVKGVVGGVAAVLFFALLASLLSDIKNDDGSPEAKAAMENVEESWWQLYKGWILAGAVGGLVLLLQRLGGIDSLKDLLGFLRP